MTEKEWLTRSAPKAMLTVVREKASKRKLRLFACACCRSLWHHLNDERARRAVEVAELYADGLVTEAERSAAEAAVNIYHEECGWDTPELTAATAASWTIIKPSSNLRFAAQVCSHNARCLIRGGKLHMNQANLFREFFGNPFRLPHLAPCWLAWNNGTVLKIARSIYDERAFERMPILADALEDAGCDNADILAHCRSEGPHVRGCWVIDLLLGKN